MRPLTQFEQPTPKLTTRRPPKEDGNEGDPNDRIRMTVDFPPTTSKRLKTLKDILEAPSHLDVLRRALALYEAMQSSYPQPAAEPRQGLVSTSRRETCPPHR
jgi:hypothetical protein